MASFEGTTARRRAPRSNGNLPVGRTPFLSPVAAAVLGSGPGPACWSACPSLVASTRGRAPPASVRCGPRDRLLEGPRRFLDRAHTVRPAWPHGRARLLVGPTPTAPRPPAPPRRPWPQPPASVPLARGQRAGRRPRSSGRPRSSVRPTDGGDRDDPLELPPRRHHGSEPTPAEGLPYRVRHVDRRFLHVASLEHLDRSANRLRLPASSPGTRPPRASST